MCLIAKVGKCEKMVGMAYLGHHTAFEIKQQFKSFTETVTHICKIFQCSSCQ